MMSSEPPAALTEPALLPVGTHSLRVLVADENRESNDHLAAMIHSWGHDVQTACETASALVVASAYRPDVVLIDLQLPEPDGGRLAQALRQQPQLKETVLIVKTAWAEQERRLFHQRSAFTLFDFVVIKPIDPPLLRNLLLLELDRRSTPRTQESHGAARTEATC